MANDCLVTTLKSIVNDNKLPRLGRVVFTVPQTESPIQYCRFSVNTPGLKLITYGGELQNPEGTNIGNEYVFQDTKIHDFWFENEETTFNLPQKELTSFYFNREFNIGELAYSPIVNMSLTQVVGSLSSVKNLTSAEIFYIYGGSVSGNLNDIPVNVYNLTLSNCPNITGDVNIFADATKFTNLEKLNLSNTIGITNKTADVKALIEAAHPGITVTW